MRNLLAGLILISPLTSFSELVVIEQHQMDLYCFSSETLFKELKNEYQEVPLLYGDTDDNIQSTMSLWIKKGGESWTIIASKKDMSCLVSTGKNLKLVKKGKPV